MPLQLAMMTISQLRNLRYQQSPLPFVSLEIYHFDDFLLMYAGFTSEEDSSDSEEFSEEEQASKKAKQG